MVSLNCHSSQGEWLDYVLNISYKKTGTFVIITSERGRIKLQFSFYVENFLVRFSGLKLVEKQIVSTELMAAVEPCKKPISGLVMKLRTENTRNWTEPDNTATVFQLLLMCLFGEPRHEFRVTVIFTNGWKNNRRKYLNFLSLFRIKEDFWNCLDTANKIDCDPETSRKSVLISNSYG